MKNIEKIKSLIVSIICIGIVLLPFNNLPYFRNILHEMANEGAFYPITLAFLFYIFYLIKKQYKLLIPQNIGFYLLSGYMLWILLSGLFNVSDILSLTFKGRSAWSKFGLQFLLIIYMFSFSLMVYNLFLGSPEKYFVKIRRAFFISFVIAGGYSIFEVLSIYGLMEKNFLGVFEKLIRDIPSTIYTRVRSVSGEPSYFAMYLAILFPFLITYLVDDRVQNKIVYYFLTIWLFFLLLLSYSRTAYLIILVEFLVFYLLIYIKTPGRLKVNILKSFFILLVSIICLLVIEQRIDFKNKEYSIIQTVTSLLPSQFSLKSIPQKNGPFYTSNIVRVSSIKTAIKMSKERLIFGYGLGQYGFHFINFFSPKIEDLGDRKNIREELTQIFDSKPGSNWPSVYSLIARILAESGLVGLLLWIGLWVWAFLKILCLVFKEKTVVTHRFLFIHAVLVSMFGIFVVMNIHDSFRYFIYWLILGFVFAWTTPKSSDNVNNFPDSSK